MPSEDPNVFCSQKQTHKAQSIHQDGKQDQLENTHAHIMTHIWILGGLVATW